MACIGKGSESQRYNRKVRRSFGNFNSISVPIPSFSIVRAASKTNSGEIIDDEWLKKPTNVYN